MSYCSQGTWRSWISVLLFSRLKATCSTRLLTVVFSKMTKRKYIKKNSNATNIIKPSSRQICLKYCQTDKEAGRGSGFFQRFFPKSSRLRDEKKFKSSRKVGFSPPPLCWTGKLTATSLCWQLTNWSLWQVQAVWQKQKKSPQSPDWTGTSTSNPALMSWCHHGNQDYRLTKLRETSAGWEV